MYPLSLSLLLVGSLSCSGKVSAEPDIIDGSTIGSECADQSPRPGANKLALRELLWIRQAKQTTKLDSAIKLLTRYTCSAPEDQPSWIDSVPVDQLYDLSRVNEISFLRACGQVVLKDRSVVCGSEMKRRKLCFPYSKPTPP